MDETPYGSGDRVAVSYTNGRGFLCEEPGTVVSVHGGIVTVRKDYGGHVGVGIDHVRPLRKD